MGWSLVTKVACGRLSDPAGRGEFPSPARCWSQTLRKGSQIGLVLDEFLGPAMQETNMRVNALYDLAVELEYKTQDAVRRRVLGPEN